jgi:uncharacterized protein (DUF305 family)
MIVLILAAVAVGVMAQMEPGAGMFMQAMDSGMKKMDHDMAAADMNGEVDHDFATMMTPHHQGAIDMAKAELIWGTNPVMRRLAEEIIVEQQSEIDVMQLWLQKKSATKANKDPS